MSNSISNYISHNLNEFGKEYKANGGGMTLDNYKNLISNTVEAVNSNINKISIFINDEELSQEQINNIKLKMPNFKIPTKYECFASIGDNEETKLVKFVLEVS